MPPDAKVVHLADFDLKNIEKYFSYADFERKISKKKVTAIANAMIDNKFTDNILRVCVGTSTRYQVLDGQHRVEALKYARDKFGLLEYDVILMDYQGGDKREIYRRLNLGKPLTLADHLKAMDTGKVEFFSKLRSLCDHYRKPGMMTYRNIINCLYYAKSSSIRAIRPVNIDDFVLGITDRDIEIIKKFIPLLHKIATNPDSIFYHYTLLRNFFRIYYENKTTDEQMTMLGEILIKSSKIHELAEKRDTYAIRGIYHYIIDVSGPEVGLSLSKGDVKK